MVLEELTTVLLEQCRLSVVPNQDTDNLYSRKFFSLCKFLCTENIFLPCLQDALASWPSLWDRHSNIGSVKRIYQNRHLPLRISANAIHPMKQTYMTKIYLTLCFSFSKIIVRSSSCNVISFFILSYCSLKQTKSMACSRVDRNSNDSQHQWRLFDIMCFYYLCHWYLEWLGLLTNPTWGMVACRGSVLKWIIYIESGVKTWAVSTYCSFRWSSWSFWMTLFDSFPLSETFWTKQTNLVKLRSSFFHTLCHYINILISETSLKRQRG